MITIPETQPDPETRPGPETRPSATPPAFPTPPASQGIPDRQGTPASQGTPDRQGSAARLPEAVLWDLDGTLVDTEPYWIEQEYALVAEYGGTWNDEHAHALVGNDLITSANYIRANGGVRLEPEQIVERLMGGVIERIRTHIPWRPGARELLAELQAEGVPCALVTMSYRAMAGAIVETLPAGSFQLVVAGDDVTHGKPHPEPYLTATARLGVRPHQCVAIEDSLTGIGSAEAAQVPVLAVQHLIPVPPGPGRTVVTTLTGWTPTALAGLITQT